MDALHLGIALGPIAVYLLLIGLLNLRKRPFVTTGVRDTGALGIAISGLFIAGPSYLIVPDAAMMRFGGYAWLMVIGVYLSILALVLVFSRPRVVVYNITARGLRQALEQWAPTLDANAHWAGDALMLPDFGVQLHLEPFAAMKSVSLVATGPRQNHLGWKALQPLLIMLIESLPQRRNPRGYSILTFSFLILGIVFWHLGYKSEQVIALWKRWVEF